MSALFKSPEQTVSSSSLQQTIKLSPDFHCVTVFLVVDLGCYRKSSIINQLYKSPLSFSWGGSLKGFLLLLYVFSFSEKTIVLIQSVTETFSPSSASL